MATRIRADVDRLPGYVPGRTIPGAIKLASNEFPEGPLPSGLAAIAEVGPVINRYPDNAVTVLTNRLASKFNVSEDQVAVGCGSATLCLQLIQATCSPTEEVVFPWRSFEAYPHLTQVVGAQ